MNIIKIGYVYMITSPSNRLYVGSTSNLQKRIYSYSKLSCKTQIKLYNSLVKYGWDNHIFEIVWTGPIEDMYKYETMIGWGFDVLESNNLNLKLPKLNNLWNCLSIETRNKMSKSKIGRILSEESKIKIRKNNKGKLRSQETKNKISYSKKGKYTSYNAIESMKKVNIGNKYNLGKVQTFEHTKKCAEKRYKIVIQMDLQNNFIKEWFSIKNAAETLNINSSSITRCCQNNKRYTVVGGFKWKYKQ